MAGNEISLTSKLSFSQGSETFADTVTTKTQNVATAYVVVGHGEHVSVNVGTVYENVPTADVTLTTSHLIRVRNGDATALLTMGFVHDGNVSNIVGAAELYPGEMFGPIRAIAQAGSKPFWQFKSNVANAKAIVSACDGGAPA